MLDKGTTERRRYIKRNLFTTEQLKWLVCMKWKAGYFQGQSMKTKMEKI